MIYTRNWRQWFVLSWLMMCGMLAFGAPVTHAQTVEKTADNCDTVSWQKNQWSTASLDVQQVQACPDDKLGTSEKALEFNVSFTGNGFEHMLVEPVTEMIIPGKTKRISFYARVDRGTNNYGWALALVDGWGMEKDGRNRKFEFQLGKQLNEQWQLFSFEIPSDWVQPLKLKGLLTHNYGSRNKPGNISLSIDQLTIETDISDVDPATGKLKGWESGPAIKDGESAAEPITPLLTTHLSTSQKHNVFAGRQPTLQLKAQSWLPGSREGTFNWTITDNAGKTIMSKAMPVRVESQMALSVPLTLPRYGLYTTDAAMKWEDGSTVKSTMKLAYLPEPANLTEQQKIESPYGLNVHGGRHRMIQTFRDAGMVWFRDYAFNFDWMVKAKGDDKKYGGWPWYPPLVKEYNDAGAMLLACHASAITNFKESDAKTAEALKPDLNWTRELVDMVLAFPSIKYHELDNEYDLPSHGNSHIEIPTDWQNYKNFHRKFGDVINVIGDGELVAVENGRAGIWPNRLKSDIESGSFRNIDVVNTHHYCGVDPPELNINNKNTDGVTQKIARLYFDQLRDVDHISSMDGKSREHWVTEFGWDTKAGHIVSHLEQAAYLQRGYMMLMATGTEKAFWFFDLDSPDANNFFDGCGLVDHEEKPKLALCSFAAMAHLLPTPKYVGMINAGDGTWGYVFDNQGELTATLWTLTDSQGPTVRFAGAELYDYLANPIAGNSVALGIAPVFAKGIERNSNWFAQTAYQLSSPLLESVTSGDTITAELAINNQRDASIRGQVQVELPTGWKTPEKQVVFACDPGKQSVVKLPITIAADQANGESVVKLHVTEGGKAIKTVPLRVRVQKRLSIVASSLVGEPGKSSTHVQLVNASASQAVGGKLHVNLPGSWQTPQPVIAIDAIAPRQTLEMNVPVTWSPSWKPNESATLSFVAANGETVETNLNPGQMTLRKASGISIDGQLSDWDAAHQVPDWVLGTTAHHGNAQLYMAWTSEGLLLAGQVEDSIIRNTDPKAFWYCDVFELFVDTQANHTRRKFVKGDHQFWLVPMPAENRMYVGQWKRGEELDKTQYDMSGIQSACRKSGNGYVFEVLLPKDKLVGFTARSQQKLGLNLNLSVHGELGPREVYWPQSKKRSDVSNPAGWGTVILE